MIKLIIGQLYLKALGVNHIKKETQSTNSKLCSKVLFQVVFSSSIEEIKSEVSNF